MCPTFALGKICKKPPSSPSPALRTGTRIISSFISLPLNFASGVSMFLFAAESSRETS
jgi:hypothetical protein